MMESRKGVDQRDSGCSVTSQNKKSSRCRSFHFRYLELCRSKNVTPQPDIKSKNNTRGVLEFYGEKINVNDWLLVVEALYNDQMLQTLAIKMRKSYGHLLEHLDTEKKAKLFRHKPVIYTKFIFSALIEAVSNCVEFNKNLKILKLEGLPFNNYFIGNIARALSSNDSLSEISFQRSTLHDDGCELICNTVKYMENVENLNMSQCGLTSKGAERVADMIRIQKISRYTQGWQKSLRYRDVDPDTMLGLRTISLARNPEIGDDGVKAIVEILKEDVWIKWIDMENCGITDRGGNCILDCLEMNRYIVDFKVNENPGISKFLLRNIHDHLGKGDEEQRLRAADGNTNVDFDPVTGERRKGKVTVALLKEQVKSITEQLVFERTLRKKAEMLNERLNKQIMAYENHLKKKAEAKIPEGYVVIKNESLQSIIRERNDYQKLAAQNDDDDDEEESSPNGASPEYYEDDEELSQPEDTARPTSTAQDARMKEQQQEQQLKLHKVRKVKSETKYAEPPSKDASKKKDSKSDHEFANEANYRMNSVHFETNIGDTLANNSNNNGPSTKRSSIGNHRNGRDHMNSLPTAYFNKHMEIDDLSLDSICSSASSESSEIETLRHDCQQMKVIIRHQTSCGGPDVGHGENAMTKIRSSNTSKKSPRSLFLGLNDD